MAESWLIQVTSPLTQGQRVRDMQWLLSGHNRFAKQTYWGEIDGFFGVKSGQAAPFHFFPRHGDNLMGDTQLMHSVAPHRIPKSHSPIA